MFISRRILLISVLGILLVLTSCSKKQIGDVSREKIPVTTKSPAALLEYQTGMEYSNTTRRVLAATHFKNALKEDPEFVLAWMNLAFVSPGTDLFLAAMDSAEKYASNASRGEQLMVEAATYGYEGKNQEQRDTIEKLVSLFPGDEMSHLLLGNYRFGLQQYRLAISSYTAAAQINNEMAILHNQLGYCQRALGNYGEAEKAFKYYIRLDSDNPNAYDSYAELLMEMGRYVESIEFYAMALERDPNFIASHLGIACNYSFLGDHGKCRSQLEVLKGIAQNHIVTRRALYAEAASYACEGDLNQAVEIMKSSFTLAQERQDVANMANDLVALGNLYLELGSPSEALASFNQSMQVINESTLPPSVVNNAHATHLYNIAHVFAVEGNHDRAKDTAEIFAHEVEMRKNPIQLQLVSQLNGILAYESKAYQKAIDELKQANQLNPYNLYRIGMSFEGLGNSDEAASYLLRAEELNILNSLDQAIVLSKTRFKKTES